MTPKRRVDDPELLEVQEIPSEEVMMVPELPTAVKVLFAKMTPRRVVEEPL